MTNSEWIDMLEKDNLLWHVGDKHKCSKKIEELKDRLSKLSNEKWQNILDADMENLARTILYICRLNGNLNLYHAFEDYGLKVYFDWIEDEIDYHLRCAVNSGKAAQDTIKLKKMIKEQKIDYKLKEKAND